MPNEIAVKQAVNNTVIGYFANEVSKFVRTMPDIISASEARRLTMSLVIKASSALEEAQLPWNKVDTKKFVNDTVRLVTMGLDAGNNEAYAIPYKNPKTGKIDLQCMASSKGLQKLVELYAIKPIKDFRSFMIKEGDNFTVTHTSAGDSWVFEEDVFGTGKVRGYVTIVIYEDDICNVMTHSKADIDKRRAASKAPNSPAWTKWYDEMAMAKAVRRHCNKISIRMPSEVKAAFDALDEEESEQITKDATPPTIALEAGPMTAPAGDASFDQEPAEEPVQEPEQPATDPEPEPVQQPVIAKPVQTIEPPKMKPAAQKAKPTQLPLEQPACDPGPADPGYDPNDTSWMQ